MAFPKFLKIGVRPTPNVMELQRNQTNHLEVKGGIEGFLLRDLARIIGFNYELCNLKTDYGVPGTAATEIGRVSSECWTEEK